MQRLYLMRDAEGARPFDAERLRNAVETLDSVGNWVEGFRTADPEGTFFQCTVESMRAGNVSVPIEVRRDLLVVSIGAYDDAGLQAALDIHRNYGEEMFAFSEESSPVVTPLSSVATVGELAHRLKLRG